MVIECPGVPAVRKLSSVNEDWLAFFQNPCHVRVLVAVQLEGMPIVGLLLGLSGVACLDVRYVQLQDLDVVRVLGDAVPVGLVVVPIVDLIATVQDELLFADV